MRRSAFFCWRGLLTIGLCVIAFRSLIALTRRRHYWIESNQHAHRDLSRLESSKAASKPTPDVLRAKSRPDKAEAPAMNGEQAALVRSGNTLTPPEKAVVIGALPSEDTSWVSELPDWTPYVYIHTPTPGAFHIPEKGREALAYLTYLVTQYDSLARTIAFVHPHRDGYPRAWHTDVPGHSNPASLQLLQTEYIQAAGFANLRCNSNPGCPEGMQLKRQTLAEEKAMVRAWSELVGDGVEVPEVLATPCCAQFAVSAEQVRKRPLSDYQRLHRWLLDTELEDPVSGRMMEYLWHFIFGQPPEFCPSLLVCYCQVYGKCAIEELNESGFLGSG